MIRGIESVLLSSENARRLAKFYREKVGLKVTSEAVMGEGKTKANIYGFEFKKTSNLYIVDHSKVKGKNKNPQRYLINFEVDGVKKEAKKLEKAKVKKITKAELRLEFFGSKGNCDIINMLGIFF